MLVGTWSRCGAWVKGNIYCGAGLFVVGKEGGVVFGARGTKSVCCRKHIRWAELFSFRLDVSVSWIVKFEIVRLEKTRTNYGGHGFGKTRC